MGRKRRDVTDAELAILQVLWDRGQSTIRQVTEILYPGGAMSEYATVKKLITRLEQKGCVGRDMSESTHFFAAAITRDELLSQRLDTIAEELCDGSRTPLLMNLLREQSLSDAERKELRHFLNDLLQKRSKK
jgi:BlaI family transcriptional regulator, penicillinase repressor